MSASGISQPAAKALELLSKFPWLEQFYLAGGTALAIQIQHRLSFDLDFFSQKEFDHVVINGDLVGLDNYRLDRMEKNTLLGIIDQTKISFFTYKYKMVSDFVPWGGIKLAGLPDIAAMKIEAIGGRGTKRDFVDLYFICQQYPIEQAFDCCLEKFGERANNVFHLIKSLQYFDDAESSPQELRMLKPVRWLEVKRFFIKSTKDLADKYLK